MDWVGVCLLGSVTALGGGSMRDILLGHYPLSWVAHPYYLLVTAGAALSTIAIAHVVHRLRNVFLVLDAIGLALFTVIGCNVALDLDLPFLIVIMSGMITGCIGGVLRDVLCNDVPLLFRSELYASVSVVAGALYVGGLRAALPHDPVMIGQWRRAWRCVCSQSATAGICRSLFTRAICTSGFQLTDTAMVSFFTAADSQFRPARDSFRRASTAINERRVVDTVRRKSCYLWASLPS